MFVLDKNITTDDMSPFDSIATYASYGFEEIERLIKNVQHDLKKTKHKLNGKLIVYDSATSKHKLIKFTKTKIDVSNCSVTIRANGKSDDQNEEEDGQHMSPKRLTNNEQEELYKEWCVENKRVPTSDEKYKNFGVGKYYFKLVSTKDKTTELLSFVEN